MKKKLLVLILTIITLGTAEIIKAADYIWPIDSSNAYETRIEYGYGKRQYDSKAYDTMYNYKPYEGLYSNYENHYGVDISGIKGHTYTVVSVANGTVLTTSLDQLSNPSLSYIDRTQRKSSTDGGGYGNYVVIKENSTGLCFLYAHLKANSVTLKKGDSVSIGDIIGTMGSSGDSGHQHLHFEVRLNQGYTTWGKNLVITTTYGLETLNPTNYIGTTAPEEIPTIITEEVVKNTKEETKTIVSEEVIGTAATAKKDEETDAKNIEEEKKYETKKEEIKTQPITAKAHVSSIDYTDLRTFGKITVTLDKNVNVAPVLKVKIKDETVYPNLISTYNNTYIYTINYNNLDVLTFGDINALIEETNNIEVYGNIIGYLKETKIPQTYADSYYYKLGDVNKDGYIDSRDASIVLRISSKLAVSEELTAEEKEQMTRADMNKDGYVNQKDATLILNYYSKRSTGLTDSKQERIINCDVTKDHIVSMSDYYAIENEIYLGPYDLKYDINGDNEVNDKDIEYFVSTLREYGQR